MAYKWAYLSLCPSFVSSLFINPQRKWNVFYGKSIKTEFINIKKWRVLEETALKKCKINCCQKARKNGNTVDISTFEKKRKCFSSSSANPLTYLSPNKSFCVLILNVYWCSGDMRLLVFLSLCTYTFTLKFKTYCHLRHLFFLMSMFYFRERGTQKIKGIKKKGQKQCDMIIVIEGTPGSHKRHLSICKKPAA